MSDGGVPPRLAEDAAATENAATRAGAGAGAQCGSLGLDLRDPVANGAQDLRRICELELDPQPTRFCLVRHREARCYATPVAMFFEEALALLRDGGVRFVVVGGTAVILHGVPRTTADPDLVVDLEPANLRRLVSAMNRLGYRPRAPVEAEDLCDPEQRKAWIADTGMRAFTFHLPGQPLSDIDILIDSPLDFAELSLRAERVDAGGLLLHIAGIEDLIRMKLVAARDQDLADADALRRLMEDRRG